MNEVMTVIYEKENNTLYHCYIVIYEIKNNTLLGAWLVHYK